MTTVVVSLVMISMASAIYIADGLQGKRILWADQICTGANNVCAHSDWLMLSAFLISLCYLTLKKDTV